MIMYGWCYGQWLGGMGANEGVGKMYEGGDLGTDK